MLALDDPRWHSLQHAYGAAGDIPERLRALAADPGPAADPGQEPWFGLWSALCHQGEVYTASFAAVPHVVQLAIDSTGAVDFSFFAFPTAVEIARSGGRGDSLPGDLADDYHRAIARLGDAVDRHRAERWDRALVLAAAAALAVAKEHVDVAEALLNLDDDWIARINGDEWP
jgi:hypothetical protein